VCLLKGQSGRAVDGGAKAGRWVAWGGISQGVGWHGMRSAVIAEGSALGMRAVAAAGLPRHALGGVGWDAVRALCWVAWTAQRCDC
jgi:hypothetical protein